MTISKVVQIALLVFIVSLYSCTEDDGAENNKLPLHGDWNLVNVSCYCAPSDLEKGEHIWDFDLLKNEVVVQNKVAKDLQILPTGTYQFELTDSTITIKNVAYDYYFENKKLILADRPESDGPLMEFVR